MNKKEFTRCVAKTMRERNVRKYIPPTEHVFHISDDDGNTRNFSIKKSNKNVLFTVDDVESVIDSCIYVIMESLKHGDPISIKGFGTLGLNKRAARKSKHVETGEEILLPEMYLPKFQYGNTLRMCAKVFEVNLKNGTLSNLDAFADEENGGEE